MATAEVLPHDWVQQEIQQSNPQAQAAEEVKRQALAIRVVDEATANEAIQFAKAIKAKAEEIKTYWKPLKDQAYKAHKALTARENELLKPLSEGEAHLKQEVAKFHAEEQRRRLEAAMKAEEEARRIAEEQLEALIEQAEAQGATANEVAALAAAPLPIVPAPVVSVPPKLEGAAIRTVWRAEVMDKAALIQYVSQRPAMQNLLEPNQRALDAFAAAMKTAANIPGVRFVSEVRTSLR